MGQPIEAVLEKRRAEILKDPHSPIVAVERWSNETGAIFYVDDDIVPDDYKIEGRRLLSGSTLVATTTGNKRVMEVMRTIVQQILANFAPSEGATGDVFGVDGGTIRQAFRNQEQVHAEFSIPASGATLEFDTTVVSEPVKVDLFSRTTQASIFSLADGLKMSTIRKSHPKVAGQAGDEIVISANSKGARQYDARFESPGVPGSAAQPEFQIHFQTDDRSAIHPTEQEFLEMWDGILSSIKPN
jgi:hypothetical protein